MRQSSLPPIAASSSRRSRYAPRTRGPGCRSPASQWATADAVTPTVAPTKDCEAPAASRMERRCSGGGRRRRLFRCVIRSGGAGSADRLVMSPSVNQGGHPSNHETMPQLYVVATPLTSLSPPRHSQVMVTGLELSTIRVGWRDEHGADGEFNFDVTGFWAVSYRATPFVFQARVRLVDGRFIVSQFGVDSAIDPKFEDEARQAMAEAGEQEWHGGITSTLLRELRMTDITEAVRRWAISDGLPRLPTGAIQTPYASETRWTDGGHQQFLERLRGAQDRVRNPGPRSKSPEELRRFAQRAADLTAERGSGSRVIPDLETEFGKSRTTIEKWINRCRELGFLEPNDRGSRRGYLPGPHLKDEQT